MERCVGPGLFDHVLWTGWVCIWDLTRCVVPDGGKLGYGLCGRAAGYVCEGCGFGLLFFAVVV